MELNHQYQNNKKTSFFILGVFLMAWSSNGFYFGGSILKFTLLITGFIFIVQTTITLKLTKESIGFGIKVLLFLLLYWGIAFYQQQETVGINLIIFDIINAFLLISGFIVSKNSFFNEEISSKTIFIICSANLLGNYFYLGNHMNFDIELLMKNNINPIGFAYVNGIIFFILFHFFSYKKLKIWTKIMLLISITSSLYIIILTESRGALIYLFLILILSFFKKNKSIKFLSYFLLYIIFFIGALNLLIYFFPIVLDKYENTFIRFQNLLEFTETGYGDESAKGRLIYFYDFFKNLDNFILFGQKGYTPYPHNLFMEIIMRWGIIFGAPLLIFNVRAFFKCLKLLVKNFAIKPLQKFFIFCFLFAFLQSMSSMSLEMNRMLWLGLGVISGLPKTNKLSI